VTGERLRVVVGDDSALIRDGLGRLLAEHGMVVVGATGHAGELPDLVERLRPDVVIADIRMPPTHTDDGLRAATAIRRAHPDVAVLVLSQHLMVADVAELVRAPGGRFGYLLKDRVTDVARLAESLRVLAAGGTVFDPEVVSRLMRKAADPLATLTNRELQVLGLVAEGATNQAIAAALGLAESTVEKHCNAVFAKLHVDADPQGHRRVLAVLAYLQAVE
jgi:DNA-binding NarL/FixJ family response regulator